MSAAMDIILLERVHNLGDMGEVVRVKPGYARNYLLPQQKALRASKDNIAYFETQRATLEKANAEKRKEAEKQAGKFKDLTVTMIRLASETGQLFGSVNARDIAEVVAEASGVKVDRSQVDLNQILKTIGLVPVTIHLHPEVSVEVTINIARTEEEAKIQEKTGKALVTDEAETKEVKAAEADEKLKKDLLEDSALKAEKEMAKEAAEKEAEEAEKEAAKSAKKATKKEEAAADDDVSKDSAATDIAAANDSAAEDEKKGDDA